MNSPNKQKKFVLLLAVSFLLFFLVYQLNSLLRIRQYLAVCNNLRQIQTALNAYYDRYGAYPAATAYNSKGEIVGGWRYSLVPLLVACSKEQLDAIDNTKWDSSFVVGRSAYCLNPESNDTTALGVVNDSRFVCDSPDNQSTIMLITSQDSKIGWGANGDVEVDEDGNILKSAPAPLYGKWLAVSFSSGVVLVLDKSVPAEQLQKHFVKDCMSNPLETFRPYVLYSTN